MKARKRNTNDEWKELDFVQLKDSYVLIQADQMEFDIPFNTENEKLHWQDVRERAAIAAMQGLLCAPSYEADRDKLNMIATDAVSIADALIEELKKR